MNQKKNNSTNVLKKIEVGNPLINLGLMSLYDHYQQAKTDEELVNAYHHILNCVEGSEVAESMVFAMIGFSTGFDCNPLFLEMEYEILKHNNSLKS